SEVNEHRRQESPRFTPNQDRVQCAPSQILSLQYRAEDVEARPRQRRERENDDAQRDEETHHGSFFSQQCSRDLPESAFESRGKTRAAAVTNLLVEGVQSATLLT